MSGSGRAFVTIRAGGGTMFSRGDMVEGGSVGSKWGGSFVYCGGFLFVTTMAAAMYS